VAADRHLHLGLLASFLAALIWSGFRPLDPFTWVLEVLPAAAGAVLLLATYRRFRFTNLAYALMWVHALILVYGGHYTYAQNPLFGWIGDAFGFTRNYYDRLGHFAQGFVPAIIAREILLRQRVLSPGAWLFFIVASICLALSAFYEFIEWWVAAATGTAAEAFLGTQGDVWDTQWDMFLALCGALLSQLSLARRHDELLQRLPAAARRR